jgi:hypothetical protein
MAGVYAPPKKYRMGSGGGKAKGAKAGGTILAFAVASMVPKSSQSATSFRPSSQAKHAFGAGSHAGVSGRAIAAMDRTARRSPEVMVRITGRQHGGGHVLANFSYISRLGHGSEKQVPLYTSDGDILNDGKDMQILAQDWQEWEMGDDARRKGATSISMILSMPAGTDPERLKEAALDFAREEFANRSWVASLHVDRDHPHVHVTFARRDHDGRRFHPSRDDLFRYRQRFAEKLRDRGIEANATPARARGIDPKHEPIAAKKVREKGQVPRIDKSRANRAQSFRDRGVGDPVNAVLANQRAAVLTAYEQSIAELSSSPSLADQAIARSLEKFVASMPAPVPNSMRAERLMNGDRDAPPQLGRDDGSPTMLDPVAAALARAKAMREQIEASKGDLEARDRPQGEPDAERPSGVSDRLRSLMDEANRPSPASDPGRADDIMRKPQERDREQRERDRTRDKDGPRR